MRWIAVNFIFIVFTPLSAQTPSSGQHNVQVHTGDCSISVVNSGSGQVNIIAPSSCGKISNVLVDFLKTQSPETIKNLNRLLNIQDLNLANAEDTIKKLQSEMERQRDIALAGQLAAEANSLVLVDPDLSALLTIESIRRLPFRENDQCLRRVLPFIGQSSSITLGSVVPVIVARPRFTISGGFILTPNDKNVYLLDPEHHKLTVELNRKLADLSPPTPKASESNSPEYIAASNAFSGMYNTFVHQLSSVVALSTTGKYLATGGGNGVVRIFDSTNGKQLGEIDNPAAVEAVAISRGGELIAVGLEDGRARIFDVRTKQLQLEFKIDVGRIDSRSLAFSADDAYLTFAPRLGRNVKVVATAGFRIVTDLRFDEALWGAALLPSGKELVVATESALTALTLPTMKEEWRDTKARDSVNLTISADGRHLAATGSGADARIYDLENGKMILDFLSRESEGAVPQNPWQSVPAEFSQNGEFVAVANRDNSISLVDLNTGKEETNLIDEDIYEIIVPSDKVQVYGFGNGSDQRQAPQRGLGRVVGFSFTSDDRQLITAFEFHPYDDTKSTGKPQFYDTETLVSQFWTRDEDLITEACSRLKLNLSPANWNEYFGDEPYHKTCPNLP